MTIDNIISNILKLKSLKNINNIFYKPYIEKHSKCSKTCGKNIKILILNTPCHGFGDVIFAIKLANYLRNWYGCTVHISTTLPQAFIQMKEPEKNIITLTGGKSTQCRRFDGLKMKKSKKYDLIFVAPLQSDYTINRADVKKLINYSNIFNTFFFSEYNDFASKNFDFPTGVGGKNLGLLMTKTTKTTKVATTKEPYALIYIAESITSADTCFLSFIEMVSVKYSKLHNKFEIIVPNWIVEEILDKTSTIITKIKKYYPTIIAIDKDKEKYIISENGNKTLTIRGDILPVNNKDMISLMDNSVKDILLTGDQSITDCLSCCSSKNIFYQIAPWKSNFGNNLAKLLPNKYLLKKKTSCGSLQAITYNSNYKSFVNKWDFRKLAKPKLDAIILASKDGKSKKQQDLVKIILSSRSISSLKKKIIKL
jgi:hypothetical protein